jgi:hypothetical protein
MPSPAPKNGGHFQVQLTSSPALKKIHFQGMVNCYNNSASFVGAGYLLAAPRKKDALQIVL